MKMVIIGSSGFIGSHASTYFQDTYEIYSLDKRPPIGSKGRYFALNTRDRDTLHSILMELNPTFILHLAAKSTVPACYEEPEEAYLDNVLGTLNVLTACRALTLRSDSCFQKLLVHTSDKVYGEHPEENLPYVETYPHYRADIYSTSKAAQDMMTLCWAAQYKLPFSTIRSGNIYGPGDLNFSRLIPQTIKRLLEGEKPVIYQGNECTIRDFVFIDDLLRAYEYVLTKGQNGEAYNVGGSGPVMVYEVIEIIKSKMQKEGQTTEKVLRDLGEFKAQYLDTEKLEHLGWKAQTPLRKGIEQCIAFYKGMFEKI